MNQKFKKTLKKAAIATTGVVAFAGTLIGGYMLTPNRTKYINVNVQEREKTLFEKFVERLTKDVGLEKDDLEEEVYLKATFSGLEFGQDFNITYTAEDSNYVNTIAIKDGELDFRLTELSVKGAEFNVDLLVDYNGQQLPVTIGHFDNNVYFGLKDLKMKFSNLNRNTILDKYFLAFYAYANLDLKPMMEDLSTLVNEKLGGLIDGLLNGTSEEENTSKSAEQEKPGFDLSSLLANAPTETHRGEQVVFTLGETEKTDGLLINLVASEDLHLKRVELENLAFGSITINGAIDIDLKPYEEFVCPASGSDYVEVFDYTALTGKVVSLFKEGNQKIGLEFGADLNNVASNVTTEIAKIRGSINIDFDKLLDLRQYQMDKPELPEDYKVVGDLEDVGFNLQLNLIGQHDVEYANLDLVFANGEGYLRFNEQEDEEGNKDAVLKLYFDTETMNWIMNKIPELIDNLSEDENTDSIETLSKFLSEELVDSIKNADFSFILEMIETLRNDREGFELGIALNKLGLGENAELVLEVINDINYFPNYYELSDLITSLNDKGELSEEEEAQLDAAISEFQAQMQGVNNSGLKLDINNIAFGNFTLDASLESAEFSEPEMGQLETYQSTKFIPDVVGQISDFVDTKKTGFEINGSLKDNSGLGISFNGQGCLDNNDDVKEGFGNMTIQEYKYRANSVWATHQLAVNVTNLKSNIFETTDENGKVKRNNQNEALFVYGDPTGSDNVKGKMHLQTFADIFDLIKTFISEEGENPKYTKFLAPITKLLGMSSLGDIIADKDYLHLASNELLKKINITENLEGTNIEVVIAKTLLGLPSDISLNIVLKKNADNKQELHSLVINDLVLSSKENAKKLNLTFELQPYNNGTQNLINKNDTFMNLDGIKTLLALGINTTKVNFYHLTAEAIIRLSGTSLIKPDLKGINFYVYVDGERVKVYGTVDKIPTVPAITIDDLLGVKDMRAEFSFETYADNTDNKVGGTFNIKRYFYDEEKDRHLVGFLKWETTYYDCETVYYYRTDSQNFLDNIATYLISGLLGIKSSIYASALSQEQDASNVEEKPAGNFTNAFTSTGFQENNGTIKLGLNLNELTGINALKELEATITSQNIAYEGSTSGIDVIDTLHATLRINFATIFNINVTLDASVAEAVVSQTQALNRWNAKAQSGFGKLTSVVVPAAYINNPDNPYEYSTRTQRA